MKPLASHQRMILLNPDNIIYDDDASSTLTLAHQPPSSGAFLKVEVSGGTNNTGNIIINDTETLIFNGADWQISANKYIPTISITTTGLADEIIKPNIKITSVDMAGNPITWTLAYSYDVQFCHVPLSSSNIVKLTSEGLSSMNMVEVSLDWDIDIHPGRKFMIEHQAGSYIVWSEPEKHFQFGTDLVDKTTFIGSLSSPSETLTEISEGDTLQYDLDFDGIVDIAEVAMRLRASASKPGSPELGEIIYDTSTGKVYMYVNE